MSSAREILRMYGIAVLPLRLSEDEDPSSYAGFDRPIRLHVRGFGGQQPEFRRSKLLEGYNWEDDFMRLLRPHIDMNRLLLIKEEIANRINLIGSWELPIVPTLSVLVKTDDEHISMDDAGTSSGPVPASESSIRDLQKSVFIDDGLSNFTENCSICMDTFNRMELLRMPCSHLYHGDCIVQWLRKSNGCPLCRYQMPKSR